VSEHNALDDYSPWQTGVGRFMNMARLGLRHAGIQRGRPAIISIWIPATQGYQPRRALTSRDQFASSPS
jgi:hypothetical protein